MGETVGPVSFEQLQRHAYEGKVAADTLVRPAESEEWVPAFTIEKLDFTRKVKLPPSTTTKATPKPRPPKPQFKTCQFCFEEVKKEAQKCRHCGEFLVPTDHSNVMALVLGLLLGPVGLWYKAQWEAGFAWLAFGLVTMNVFEPAIAFIVGLFVLVGSAFHAFAADGKR